MVALNVVQLAAQSPSAGGAELGQVAVVSALGLLLTTSLLVLGLGHRSGRIAVLGRVGGFAERAIGLPAWAALPLAIAVPTLLMALFGLTWDESLHLDDGRDPGPLANPSHYFLLAGLFGIFTAGWLSLVLPARGERPGPAAVRLGPGWYVPVGGLLTIVCAAVALAGFPLDDVSHRLFGQDVSLWGTTHLQMLTGAATGVVGLAILFREGVLAERAHTGTDKAIVPLVRVPLAMQRLVERFHYAMLGGGLLAALSIFQGEFDYGIPQYRLVFHPILIAGMGAFALVAIRALAGPGMAFVAAAWFIVVRGVITLLVGPVLGESVASFPLYLAEAAIVEAVALVVVAKANPYRLGVVSGALIGSVGVLAEYGWSQLWMPLPWPAHMLPTAIAWSVPVAVACGLLGAFLYCGLDRRPVLIGSRGAIAAATASVLVIGVAFGFLRGTSAPDVRASVTLTEVRAAPHREVVATLRLDPPQAARGADWFTTLAYQGKAPLRLDRLRQISPGVYRTVALPVHGAWKSAVRLHRGGEMSALAIFLPGDDAIPAAEVPAPAAFQRAFVSDHELLQRERKEGVSPTLEKGFALLILLVCMALLALLARGLVHLARSALGAEATAERSPGSSQPPAVRRVPAGAR